MRVGFVTFEQFYGRTNIGSSRIRADWVINHWDNAERYYIGKDYDVIIYQKAYWTEHAEAFNGIKILDLCDPDWLSWGYKLREMVDLVDAITCSTVEIAKFMVNMTNKPVWVIPDRLDFSQMGEIKQHKGDLKKLVWYGYQQNQEQLHPAIPILIKKDIELIVLSNKVFVPYRSEKDLKLTNLLWSEDNWQYDIMKGDAVLIPKYEKGRFRYKSNNKTIQSWALGMPVIRTDKDLDRFASENSRNKEAEKRLKEVMDKYDVRDSVTEYKGLIDDIIKNKSQTAIGE